MFFFFSLLSIISAGSTLGLIFVQTPTPTMSHSTDLSDCGWQVYGISKNLHVLFTGFNVLFSSWLIE